LSGNDFVRLFEDWKKIEISFQITPPLKQKSSERFQSRSAISKLQSFLRPEIRVNYFLSFPQKTSHQRNCRIKKLSNFEKLQFWDAKIDQNTNHAKLPKAFF
jgi:hypothetical protein